MTDASHRRKLLAAALQLPTAAQTATHLSAKPIANTGTKSHVAKHTNVAPPSRAAASGHVDTCAIAATKGFASTGVTSRNHQIPASTQLIHKGIAEAAADSKSAAALASLRHTSALHAPSDRSSAVGHNGQPSSTAATACNAFLKAATGDCQTVKASSNSPCIVLSTSASHAVAAKAAPLTSSTAVCVANKTRKLRHSQTAGRQGVEAPAPAAPKPNARQDSRQAGITNSQPRAIATGQIAQPVAGATGQNSKHTQSSVAAVRAAPKDGVLAPTSRADEEHHLALALSASMGDPLAGEHLHNALHQTSNAQPVAFTRAGVEPTLPAASYVVQPPSINTALYPFPIRNAVSAGVHPRQALSIRRDVAVVFACG